ncbi:hypothetical protein CF98_00210 [Halopseudomonas bauzanensis]|nr:hypothetical protein CF98_00210 [Halopseudomonas bauzanensis]
MLEFLDLLLPGGQLLADLILLASQAGLCAAFVSQCGGQFVDSGLSLGAGLLCLGSPVAGAIGGGLGKLGALVLNP